MAFVVMSVSVLLGAGAILLLAVRVLHWRTNRPGLAVPASPPGLPEGHQPPPGLSPLSPSERFLTSEVARGLRDLQLFLHEAARGA
jgi:hypothetical protein